jgi:hypothetical protein
MLNAARIRARQMGRVTKIMGFRLTSQEKSVGFLQDFGPGLSIGLKVPMASHIFASNANLPKTKVIPTSNMLFRKRIRRQPQIIRMTGAIIL